MQTSKMLQIVSIDGPMEASDGRQFKTVGFQAKEYLGNQEVLSNEPVRFRNLWELGPPSAKGLTDFSKGDPLFKSAKVGALVNGSVHTRTVESYTIRDGDDPVSIYTCVKFAHESVQRAFNNQGHAIVDTETGEILRASIAGGAPVSPSKEESPVESLEESEEEQL